jgi:serine/threonine protein kinase
LLRRIDRIYKLLHPLHQRAGTAKRARRKWENEYKWYLRDYDTDEWSHSLKVMWPPLSTTVMLGGSSWVNPLHVWERLRTQDAEMLLGAVHGDVHPRNIVISADRGPHIIDFGWAHDLGHIAKDFVLMEANLRFVLLNADVAEADVVAMSKWLSFGSVAPSVTQPYCADQIRLIEKVRDEARHHFGDDANWDVEYLVPLFIVSLGLLRFLSEFRNQFAAIRTVLELARYISSAGMIARPAPSA